MSATEDQKAAFAHAGIPSTYINGNLGTMGEPAALLLAYVKSPSFEANMREGRGVWLHGHDERCEEALHHVCKSAMIRAIDALVLTPIALHEALTSTEDEGVNEVADALWHTDAFFLSCFDDAYYEANPMPAKDRHNIEDFLLSRVRNGKAVSVHASGPGTSHWWSPRLVTRLANSSEMFAL